MGYTEFVLACLHLILYYIIIQREWLHMFMMAIKNWSGNRPEQQLCREEER